MSKRLSKHLTGKCSLFLGAICAVVSASGCAAEAEGELLAEETGSTQQALGEAYFQRTWSQGESPIMLDSAVDYVCALTGVSGKFRGVGEEVKVTVNDNNRWQLEGKSNQSGVSGSTTCYRKDQFVGGSGVKLFSWEFIGSQTSPKKCGFLGIGDCVWPAPAPTLEDVWNGISATMITGMTGDFRSANEFIEVRQSAGSAPSRLAAQNYIRHNETSRMYARSFFVGKDSGARFVGKGGLRGNATVGEFDAGGINGVDSERMAPANQAFCYLTHLSGSFSGASNWAKIQEDHDGYWRLSVSGTSGARVSARARCLLLDQR